MKTARSGSLIDQGLGELGFLGLPIGLHSPTVGPTVCLTTGRGTEHSGSARHVGIPLLRDGLGLCWFRCLLVLLQFFLFRGSQVVTGLSRDGVCGGGNGIVLC